MRQAALALTDWGLLGMLPLWHAEHSTMLDSYSSIVRRFRLLDACSLPHCGKQPIWHPPYQLPCHPPPATPANSKGLLWRPPQIAVVQLQGLNLSSWEFLLDALDCTASGADLCHCVCIQTAEDGVATTQQLSCQPLTTLWVPAGNEHTAIAGCQRAGCLKTDADIASCHLHPGRSMARSGRWSPSETY